MSHFLYILRLAMNALTFPGVIIHKLFYQLFCRILSIPVLEVVYFRQGDPPGYVLHETVQGRWKTIIICLGPFLASTILGVVIALPAVTSIFSYGNAGMEDWFKLYLGVSMAVHAFPSTGNVNAILKLMREENTPFRVKLAGYPVAVLMYPGSEANFFWHRMVYGTSLVIGIPYLINLFVVG